MTATIGADGGEITATGSDGATFVLSIPQGALAGVEEITLTPVLSVSNFPMSGGLIGAVFVGPQDLVLTELATLTIQTSAVADGWTLTSFGFHDGEVFLIPVFPEGASVSGTDDVVVTLPTIGAGGVGVGAASEADAQLIVAHSPSDPVDLLRQRIADILHRSPNGPTPEVLAEAEQITQDFYVWNLRLVIGAAKVDCDAAWTLVHRFMWWLTPIQIGFTQTAFAAERAEVEIGIAAGMANCFEEAYLRCTRGGDRRVELARMLKAWGVVLAGIGPEELFRELVGSPEQKVTECFPCTALGRTTAMVPQVQDMSIGELPCGWRGTIEKSDTQNGEDWHRTFTITGELTWRRTPESFIPFECESVSPPCTVYFATGTIQWHYTYSIDRGDYHCDENRSGAFDVRQPSSEDWWQQSLRVSSTDAGIEYSGDGDYYEGDTPAQFISDCEGPQNIGPWLVTGDDPVVSPDAGVIEGSHLIPLSDPPGLVEYQWELTALPE